MANGFEVGQVWKTRGGWEARIVAIINDIRRPVVAVHSHNLCPEDGYVESCEPHAVSGAYLGGEESGWDLIQLKREAA